MTKQTFLHDKHVHLGAKMVDFAGWHMPIQYTSIIEEHKTVRESVGLFDVSHMGEILCEGKDALANLNHILTNDFTNMVDGQARYAVMCNDKGGCVDDLIVYNKNNLLKKGHLVPL